MTSIFSGEVRNTTARLLADTSDSAANAESTVVNAIFADHELLRGGSIHHILLITDFVMQKFPELLTCVDLVDEASAFLPYNIYEGTAAESHDCIVAYGLPGYRAFSRKHAPRLTAISKELPSHTGASMLRCGPRLMALMRW